MLHISHYWSTAYDYQLIWWFPNCTRSYHRPEINSDLVLLPDSPQQRREVKRSYRRRSRSRSREKGRRRGGHRRSRSREHSRRDKKHRSRSGSRHRRSRSGSRNRRSGSRKTNRTVSTSSVTKSSGKERKDSVRTVVLCICFALLVE